MAVELSVKAPDLTKAAKSVKDMRERLKDLRPALRPTAEQFKALIDAAFLTSSDPSGSPWPVLQPSTVKQKQRLGFSTKPLIRHGARGLQGKVFAIAQKLAIKIGFPADVGYGGYHIAGTSRIPVRNFLPLERSGSGYAVMRAPKVQAIMDDMEKRIAKHVFGESD